LYFDQRDCGTGAFRLSITRRAARGVEFENTNFLGSGKEYARFMVPGSPKMYAGYDMNVVYRDTDVMVSLAKLKDHRITGVTLSMKNMFGILPTTIYGANAPVDEPATTVLPGNRGSIHVGSRVPPKSAPAALDMINHEPGYRMPRVVPELVAARPIYLAIIDGIYSMEGGELPSRNPGQGPTNALHPGVLIAGMNPVCSDWIHASGMCCCRMLPMPGTFPLDTLYSCARGHSWPFVLTWPG
jgi:hypothetical protein